jgi:phosphoribosylformimino-5-aminoimidazole carboxamide ribotide isomerase
MILVIPALALHHGKCTFFVKGETGTEETYFQYSGSPDMLCKLLRRENAKTIHITDLDVLFGGKNESNIEQILSIAKAVDIPIQLLTEFKNFDECKKILDNGIYRVILFDLAYRNPDGVRELLRDYTTSRISFLVNSLDERIRFWNCEFNIGDSDYVNYLKDLGATRIIIRDEARFDSLEGIDFNLLNRVSDPEHIKITVFGMVNNPRQLWDLQNYESFGIDSVIIGKPLYQNAFPCQKIWRLAEAELE